MKMMKEPPKYFSRRLFILATLLVGSLPAVRSAQTDMHQKSVETSSDSAGSSVIGTLIALSSNQLCLIKKGGGIATFGLKSPIPVEGSQQDVSHLDLYARIKVWPDQKGYITRVSLLSIDFNDVH